MLPHFSPGQERAISEVRRASSRPGQLRLTLLVAVQVDNLFQANGHGVVPVNAAEGRSSTWQGHLNSDALPPDC